MGTISVMAGSNLRASGERRVRTKSFSHPVYADSSPFPLVTNTTLWKDHRKKKITDDNEKMRQYFAENKFDIALIKLDKPFSRLMDGRHYVLNTICLPTRNTEAYADDWATFFGFGTIEHWTQIRATFHDYLLKGDVWLQQYMTVF